MTPIHRKPQEYGESWPENGVNTGAGEMSKPSEPVHSAKLTANDTLRGPIESPSIATPKGADR